MRSPLCRFAGLACVVAVVALAVACSSPVSDILETTGLVVSLSGDLGARTLAPATDMNPVSYTITGTGPEGATFTSTTTGSSVTITRLASGTWTLSVTAVNAGGAPIGAGSAIVVVTSGVTSAVTVVVTPISGTGVLSLGIAWPAGSVMAPSVNASLTPAFGTATVLPFAIEGNGASFGNSAIANGYYTLGFTILNGGSVVAGAVDVVRIVTGQTTSGTYSFTNVNAPGGSLRLTIVNNLQNPLSVKIFGGNPYLSAGNTQALTAGVSNFTGDVVYTWYVNGALAGTGASYRFGASRPLGFYRIDATAFSVTGGRSGSATMNVRVVGSIPAVSSTFPADGASGVALNTIVTAKFNGVMDASTITTATFTLKLGSSPVAGSVSYTGTTATFTPAAPLSGTAVYTASLSGEIRDQAGVPLVTQRSWTFTTLTPPLGPPAVAMGTAGNFAVLARTGITIGAAGRVTGNVGLSASGAAGLVFASTQDASRTFSTSSLVSGRIYSTDDIAPTPGLLLTAAADERSAYGDARGRGPANFTNRGAGRTGRADFRPRAVPLDHGCDDHDGHHSAGRSQRHLDIPGRRGIVRGRRHRCPPDGWRRPEARFLAVGRRGRSGSGGQTLRLRAGQWRDKRGSRRGGDREPVRPDDGDYRSRGRGKPAESLTFGMSTMGRTGSGWLAMMAA